MLEIRREGRFRDISIKLLFPLFWKSGLSANQITILNFLTFCLGSVILFATGHEILGLVVAGIGAMVDVIDGTVARKGRGSPNGEYLDTSLDYVYLMFFIGAISYYHKIITFGYLTLIAITFGDWIKYHGKVNWELPFPLHIKHLVTIGVLIRHLEWAMLTILFVQWFRTTLLYKASLERRYHETILDKED